MRSRLAALALLLLATSVAVAADLKEIAGKRIREFDAESVGIYFETPDGKVLSYNADSVFHAASTMKVPVMMEVFRQVEEGRLKLDQKILVKNEFASIMDGSPFSLSKEDDSDQELYAHLGEEMPLEALMERMINSSSNLATDLIIQIVDPANVMKLMSEIGAKDETVLRGVEDNKAYEAGRNNTTSARSLAICLKAILDPKRFSKDSREKMFAILLSQKYKEIGDALKAANPGLQVASKDGFITEIYHDAAIIRDANGKDSILVILTRGAKEEKDGIGLIKALAADIWSLR